MLEDASKKFAQFWAIAMLKPLSFEEETGKMILSYENKTRCTHVKNDMSEILVSEEQLQETIKIRCYVSGRLPR